MVFSTSAGLMRWSKATKKSGVSGCGDPDGYMLVTTAGGVLNFQLTGSASTPPEMDFVPAGTVTWYSVALGSRSIRLESYSNVRVLTPNQRHVPGRAGSMRTGTSLAARSASVPSGTMAWLKVMLTNGAIGISPSGAKRSTCSAPAAEACGVGAVSRGGNLS